MFTPCKTAVHLYIVCDIKLLHWHTTMKNSILIWMMLSFNLSHEFIVVLGVIVRSSAIQNMHNRHALLPLFDRFILCGIKE